MPSSNKFNSTLYAPPVKNAKMVQTPGLYDRRRDSEKCLKSGYNLGAGPNGGDEDDLLT